jgi:hypothetical protein
MGIERGLDREAEHHDLTSIAGKLAYVRAVLPRIITLTNQVERTEYLSAIVKRTGISPSGLADELHKLRHARSHPAIVDERLHGAHEELSEAFLKALASRALGWILEQHCQLTWTNSGLEIHFSNCNRMAHELLHEDETRRTLEATAKQVVGAPVAVRIIDAPPSAAGG